MTQGIQKTSQFGNRLAAAILLGLLASPAGAATFTAIPQPDAAYQASTTKIDISALTCYSSYGSITDGTQTVTFATSMEKRTVSSCGWASWSSPPNSESATPHVLYSQGQITQTLTMSKPTVTFGFELEPNPFAVIPFTADFILMSGPTVVGTIPIAVDGSYGARLFAASVTGTLIDKVVITGTTDFSIAQVRYDTWDGWVTGGGTVKQGKKSIWTFGGNAGWDEAVGFGGQFQIRDHVNQKSYHFDTVTFLAFDGVATLSPASKYNRATWLAEGSDNLGNPASVKIVVQDILEPGKGSDTIAVTGDVNFSATINGGNFQVHPPQ